MIIGNYTLKYIKELGEQLIFFSQAKGIAKVVTNQGTFYAPYLIQALVKAVVYRNKNYS